MQFDNDLPFQSLTSSFHPDFLPQSPTPNTNPPVPTSMDDTITENFFATDTESLRRHTTEIIVWGQDDSGQLGIGGGKKSDRKTQCIPRSCKFQTKIIKIACGSKHSGFVTLDGSVYVMGSNSAGQLGIGDLSIQYESKPTLVESLSSNKSLDIACSKHSTFVLTDSDLFAFGSGKHGLLGLDSYEDSSFPIQVVFDSHDPPSLKNISCGNYHVAATCQNGMEIFVWGKNSHGQLGVGDNQDRYIPEQLCVSEKVKSVQQVKCGHNHTLLLKDNGELYSTGKNQNCELGFDDIHKVNAFTKLKDLPPIKTMAASDFSIAISTSGDLYAWGPTPRGSLPEPVNITKSSKMLEPIEFSSVDIGEQFSILVDSYGRAYSWGANHNGECGVGDFEQRQLPTLIESMAQVSINSVVCGKSFSICQAKPGSSRKLVEQLSNTSLSPMKKTYQNPLGTTRIHESSCTPIRDASKQQHQTYTPGTMPSKRIYEETGRIGRSFLGTGQFNQSFTHNHNLNQSICHSDLNPQCVSISQYQALQAQNEMLLKEKAEQQHQLTIEVQKRLMLERDLQNQSNKGSTPREFESQVNQSSMSINQMDFNNQASYQKKSKEVHDLTVQLGSLTEENIWLKQEKQENKERYEERIKALQDQLIENNTSAQDIDSEERRLNEDHIRELETINEKQEKQMLSLREQVDSKSSELEEKDEIIAHKQREILELKQLQTDLVDKIKYLQEAVRNVDQRNNKLMEQFQQAAEEQKQYPRESNQSLFSMLSECKFNNDEENFERTQKHFNPIETPLDSARVAKINKRAIDEHQQIYNAFKPIQNITPKRPQSTMQMKRTSSGSKTQYASKKVNRPCQNDQNEGLNQSQSMQNINSRSYNSGVKSNLTDMKTKLHDIQSNKQFLEKKINEYEKKLTELKVGGKIK